MNHRVGHGPGRMYRSELHEWPAVTRDSPIPTYLYREVKTFKSWIIDAHLSLTFQTLFMKSLFSFRFFLNIKKIFLYKNFFSFFSTIKSCLFLTWVTQLQQESMVPLFLSRSIALFYLFMIFLYTFSFGKGGKRKKIKFFLFSSDFRFFFFEIKWQSATRGYVHSSFNVKVYRVKLYVGGWKNIYT